MSSPIADFFDTPWVRQIGGVAGYDKIRRVPYDVAAMAAAIRAADGLPDHFARDIETGGLATVAG